MGSAPPVPADATASDSHQQLQRRDSQGTYLLANDYTPFPEDAKERARDRAYIILPLPSRGRTEGAYARDKSALLATMNNK